MSVSINGKQFDWGDISISIIPISPIIFTAKTISWEEEYEATPIYGKGRVPVGYGKGNWRSNGRIEMLKSEFEALNIIAPKGILGLDPRITTINIIYNNLTEGLAPLAVNTLTNVCFTKISDTATQGDKELKVGLDFLILGDIKRNGKSSHIK